MSGSAVACTNCAAPLPSTFLDGSFHPCPSCQTSIQVHLFPAFTNERPTAATESTLIEGEASCFYHPHKKALLACEGCGRFVCALCDVEIGGVHRCPRCLEAGKRKQVLQTLELQHVRYDRIAFALTTISLLLWPITIITAPAALFLVIRFWNRRSKILPGSRFVFILAGLIAIAEMCGWALIIYILFRGGLNLGPP